MNYIQPISEAVKVLIGLSCSYSGQDLQDLSHNVAGKADDTENFQCCLSWVHIQIQRHGQHGVIPRHRPANLPREQNLDEHQKLVLGVEYHRLYCHLLGHRVQKASIAHVSHHTMRLTCRARHIDKSQKVIFPACYYVSSTIVSLSKAMRKESQGNMQPRRAVGLRIIQGYRHPFGGCIIALRRHCAIIQLRRLEKNRVESVGSAVKNRIVACICALGVREILRVGGGVVARGKRARGKTREASREIRHVRISVFLALSLRKARLVYNDWAEKYIVWRQQACCWRWAQWLRYVYGRVFLMKVPDLK
mmetsp:Transcript_2395/g.3364  ORF Transcript_2395/g.3364 Transcript_2395/m.3364 type:complete len:306 (-) Transcript_2395:1142-2059(-)